MMILRPHFPVWTMRTRLPAFALAVSLASSAYLAEEGAGEEELEILTCLFSSLWSEYLKGCALVVEERRQRG